jgi:hypothetical protein
VLYKEKSSISLIVLEADSLRADSHIWSGSGKPSGYVTNCGCYHVAGACARGWVGEGQNCERERYHMGELPVFGWGTKHSVD